MIALVAVVVLGGLAVAGWRVHWPPALFGSTSAAPPMTWSAAQAPLPIDATVTASQFTALNDVSCPNVSFCVAVGSYSTGSSANEAGLIETFSGHTWSSFRAPLTVAGAAQVNYVDLDGIACPTDGACVAVGAYSGSQGIEFPLIETFSNGTWASAKAALPGDAATTKNSFISEVACPALGDCVATGWYTDRNGDTQPLVDTLSGGTWTPTRAPVPDDATSKPSTSGLPSADLFAVRCSGSGNCVATGNYTASGGHIEGMIDTLADGTWTAARAPLPGDAAANPTAYLFTVDCQPSGSCLAAGHYNSRAGQSRDFVASGSGGGGWTPADTPLPSDAAASQKWNISQLTGLTAVACREAGACVAAGSYIEKNGTLEGMIDALSGGTWTTARAPLPTFAAVAKQFVFFDSAACPAPGTCYIVGGYKAPDGSTQSLIESGAAAHG